MLSPFMGGLAGGFSESVTAAIEKEQKSIDDLFQTQFKVRLNRRLADLDKDREDLSDASKQLTAYNTYTGGNLNNSAQLYNIGAGLGHDDFLKKLGAIRLEGRDPLEGVVWAEQNNLPVGSTLDEYSRALISPPTIAPIEPLQMGGNIMGSLRKVLGVGGDASGSSAARRKADRLATNLQSMAPIREASEYTIATPTLKEGFNFETNLEATARKISEVSLSAQQDRTAHLKLMYPHLQTSAINAAAISGVAADLATMTRDNELALSNDQVALAAAQRESAQLELTNYKAFGRDKEEAALQVAQAQVKAYENPENIENAIGALTWELHQINTELESPRLSLPQRTALERKKEQLTVLKINFFATQQKLEDISAATTTTNRATNLGSFNSLYNDIETAVFSRISIDDKKFVRLPDETGQLRLRLVSNINPKSEDGIAALAELDRLDLEIAVNFLDGSVEGTDEQGRLVYITDSAGITARSRINTGVRLAYAQRSHYKDTSPATFVTEMRNKGEKTEHILTSLQNIYGKSKTWLDEFNQQMESLKQQNVPN